MPRLLGSPPCLEQNQEAFATMVRVSLDNPELFFTHLKTIEKFDQLLQENLLAFLTARNEKRLTNKVDKVDRYCWNLAKDRILSLAKRQSELFQRFIAQETRAGRLVITEKSDGGYYANHPLTGCIVAFMDKLEDGWEVRDFGPYPAPHAFLKRGKERWKAYEAPVNIGEPSPSTPSCHV